MFYEALNNLDGTKVYRHAVIQWNQRRNIGTLLFFCITGEGEKRANVRTIVKITQAIL